MTPIDEDLPNDSRAAAEDLLSRVSAMHLRLMRSRSSSRKAWGNPREGQGRVLALLSMKPEITQRELTFLLGMSRQALAELLAKLERQGLIERSPSPEDRRVVQVRLTDAGRNAAENLDPASGPSSVLDGFDDEEVDQLSGYLSRIVQNLESQADQLRGSADPNDRFGGDPRMGRGGRGPRRDRGGFGGGAGGQAGPWGRDARGGRTPFNGWER